MRWGRSCGGVSRGVVEAPDGEMSLLPAASFQLLSGFCRSTIGVGGAVVSLFRNRKWIKHLFEARSIVIVQRLRGNGLQRQSHGCLELVCCLGLSGSHRLSAMSFSLHQSRQHRYIR